MYKIKISFLIIINIFVFKYLYCQGSEWEEKCIPLQPDVVYFENVNTGWIAGTEETQMKIYKTTDIGGTWNQIFSVTKINPHQYNYYPVRPSIYFNGNVGFCFYGGYLRKTLDGGNNWYNPDIFGEEDNSLSTIKFLNQTTGYLAYTPPDHTSGTYLRKTTDGGSSWIEIAHYTPGSNYLYFTDIGISSNGYAHFVGFKKIVNSGIVHAIDAYYIGDDQPDIYEQGVYDENRTFNNIQILPNDDIRRIGIYSVSGTSGTYLFKNNNLGIEEGFKICNEYSSSFIGGM